MASILTDLLNQGISRGIMPAKEQLSRDWYRNKARDVTGVNRNTLTETGQISKVLPGMMLMFFYDPKTKDKLPYYDRFPLVFPIDANATGFIGLNLHYLAQPLRAQLMDALYGLADKNITESSRLSISYNILKGSSRFKGFKACLKKYLYKQVKSKFTLVPADQWDIALFLPTEDFVKAPLNKVHLETTRMVS